MIRLGICMVCEMKENERSGSVARKKEMSSYLCPSMFSKSVPLPFSRTKGNASSRMQLFLYLSHQISLWRMDIQEGRNWA